MLKIEQIIVSLKQKVNRDNFYFLRRRIDKGNGKKSLGWIVKREDTNKELENFDFYKLCREKEQLKEK